MTAMSSMSVRFDSIFLVQVLTERIGGRDSRSVPVDAAIWTTFGMHGGSWGLNGRQLRPRTGMDDSEPRVVGFHGIFQAPARTVKRKR